MEHHHPKKTTRLPKNQSHESSFSADPVALDEDRPCYATLEMSDLACAMADEGTITVESRWSRPEI